MKAKDIFERPSGIFLSIRTLFFVCFVLIGLALSSVTYGQKNLIAQQVNQLVTRLQDATQRGMKPEELPRISVSKEGYLRFIGAPPSFYFPVSLAVPGNPEQTAYNFLKEYASLFGVTSASVDFKVLKIKSKNRRSYVRFQQTYSDIPVFGGEVMVQLNDLGGVECVMSDIARDTKVLDNGIVSVIPLISEADAGARVIDKFVNENPDFEVRATLPRLTIFVPSVLGATGSMRLAWDIRVYSEESTHINELVLLDAHDGDIVRNYPLNKHALDREIYDSNNTTADPGTLERDEGDPPSGIADVDDAYDFFEDTYDFYYNEHGRDGINGSGMTISATVRYCYLGKPCPYSNAFWNGSRLYFGDGFVVDDVVGHEYTHGVTDYESNLIYENHSGAINESFSDVWGEFIDLGNGAGNDNAGVRWEIGEDLLIGAIRDMSDPPAFGDPDRLGHPNFVQPVPNPNPTNDYGGVHTNCGVNNKLCFLLTDGDTFNGQTVTGIGISGVADLYYEVQTNILTSGADYTDLYHALKQAAVNLGWSIGVRNNLYRACVAVEIAEERNIYVDWANTGKEDGTIEHPFNTVIEGLNAAFPGDRLFIKSGSYNETITFSKEMEVIAWEGMVTIGQ
jgi:bacillolysin